MQCQMKLENGRTCGGYVFKCKACNGAGCSNKECRNQAFDNGTGRCFRCGQTSAR